MASHPQAKTIHPPCFPQSLRPSFSEFRFGCNLCIHSRDSQQIPWLAPSSPKNSLRAPGSIASSKTVALKQSHVETFHLPNRSLQAVEERVHLCHDRLGKTSAHPLGTPASFLEICSKLRSTTLLQGGLVGLARGSAG